MEDECRKPKSQFVSEIAYRVGATFDEELTLQPLKKHILKHKEQIKTQSKITKYKCVQYECNLDLLHPSIVM